jgi:hypothetical protein
MLFCPDIRKLSLSTAASGICTDAVTAESNPPHTPNSGRINAVEMLNATNAISENCEDLAGKSSLYGSARLAIFRSSPLRLNDSSVHKLRCRPAGEFLVLGQKFSVAIFLY